MSRRLTIAAAVAVFFGGALGFASATAAEPSCAYASDLPAPATLQAANDAVLCLVNAERAKRGIARLKVAPALTRAAQAHSADMVKRQYFSHVTPGGWTPRRRIQRAGYVRKRAGSVNETIAIGVAERSAPAALVRSLLDDLPHRRIVLSRRYRNIGVGLVLGYPTVDPPDQSTTLTVTYGRR